MGVQLLDKTRKINKLLHNNSSSKVVFNDICEVLTEILDSNVLVISKKGKVLGGSKCEGVPYITELIEREIGKHVDDMLNERLLSILSTKENVNLQTLGFSEEAVKGYQAIITPIDIAGERLGTLFIYKKDKVYEIDGNADKILAYMEACKYPHDVYYTSNSSYFYMPLGRIIEKEGLTTKVWNHLKKNGGYGDFISIIRAYDYINNKKMCKRLFTRFFQYCEFLVYDESYYEQNTE